MGLRFIREPSDTPNVQIGDDVRAFRYAYGDQNGYIKGKGTECGYEVNGLNFIIKSGEIVVNGYSSEIDANGVILTVDNIATKRYYSVYYQVNLATYSVSIMATYDTASYPVISAGDDLNINTIGTARMELYRFTATSGVISEVSKRVQPIAYSVLPSGVYDGLTAGYAKWAETKGATDNSTNIATTKHVKDYLASLLETTSLTHSSGSGIFTSTGSSIYKFYTMITGLIYFGVGPTVTISSGTTLFTITSSYRPATARKAKGILFRGNGDRAAVHLTINENGTITNDYEILAWTSNINNPNSYAIINFSYLK